MSRPDSVMSDEGGGSLRTYAAAVREGSPVFVMGSESESVAGRVLTRRKRAKAGRLWAEGVDTDSDGSGEPQRADLPFVPPVNPAPKVSRSVVGRGGYHHSVGLSQARKELDEGPDDSESSTLTEVEPTPTPRSSPKKKKGASSPLWAIDLSVEELEGRAEFGASRIEQVLLKSKNLKGTCVKEIREASLSLMRAVRALAAKQDGEEMRRLAADNKRLRGQMEALSGEVTALRRAFSERQVPTKAKAATAEAREERPAAGLTREELADAMGAMQRELMRHIGGVITARLQGLEVDGRLLPAQTHRPPLQADGTAPKPMAAAAKKPAAVKSGPTTLAPPANLPRQAQSQKGPKKATSKEGATRAVAQIAGPSNEVQPLVDEEGWTVVASKPKTPKKKAAAPVQKQAPKVPKPPKTLAVILTLKPEAVAKGATYNAALMEARQKVSLAELGIGPGKFRRSMTGACIMELPRETTAAQADTLAERMGAALGDAAVVTRPTKMAEIRVVGFDDSVSAEEVRGALAEKAGCPVEKIKVGAISVGVRGMGAVLASCPVEAAAKLVEAGKLVVGWSAATIKALEQRVMRCHRCLEKGHTQFLCPSKKDRSALCYRCGKEGHIASSCTAPMRCIVCADRGQPADHALSGPRCTAPAVKGRAASVTAARGPKAAAAATATKKVTPMDTNAQ
jgi:hypothetical protein